MVPADIKYPTFSIVMNPMPTLSPASMSARGLSTKTSQILKNQFGDESRKALPQSHVPQRTPPALASSSDKPTMSMVIATTGLAGLPSWSPDGSNLLEGS